MRSTSSYTHCYAPGETIFREGETGNSAFIIEKGKVEVSVMQDGQKRVVAEYTAGDLVGEMSLIDNSPRSATITAVEATEVITIYRSLFDMALDDLHPVVRLMIRTIMYQRRKANPSPRDRQEQSEFFDAQKRHDPGYLNDFDETVNLVMAEHELSMAIDAAQFEVYYQPVISLTGNETVGIEALVRWNHPDGDLIAGDEIMPIAEKTSLIKKLGEFIIDRVCMELGELGRQLPQLFANKPDFFISINLSAKQFIYPDFLENIRGYIDKHAVNPAHIMFEITENVLMLDPDTATSALNSFKELGFQVAIDDFGKGYSSLSYLHTFPIDTIKIDKSFISSMYSNATSMTIIHAITDLARVLDLKVIAEGVESEDQLRVVNEFGCDLAQGYQIASPMPYAEILEYLKTH